jgi:hypothetical protein
MRDLIHTMTALDGTPIERHSDRLDGRELADKLYEVAVMLRDKYGLYDRYQTLKDAAEELEVLDAELVEARAHVESIKGELIDMRDQLAMYRVVETFPATRETPAEFGVCRSADPDEDHGE